MPTAEIITIGTEILLGEIVDTNARHLAINLRESGIDLFRKTTVGDNPNRIAQAIQEALERSDIVITTGGLGPTVDDPTREAVALAIGVPIEYHPELWQQIQERFQRYNRQPTENNRRQAFIPQGALAIENPVGTAPSFIVEISQKCIIALPGVPAEMRYLLQHVVLPYLRQHYQINSVLKTRTLHTSGVGESQIDDLISDLETLANPTVGLAAHSGQVDVRIVAKAESQMSADDLINAIENELRQRLGEWIYGADADTLEKTALRALESKNWRLAVVECGTAGEMGRRLAHLQSAAFSGSEIVMRSISSQEFIDQTENFRQYRQAEVGLGIQIQPGSEQQIVLVIIITPDGSQRSERPYGGPPEYAPRWAVNHSLDLIRKLGKEIS